MNTLFVAWFVIDEPYHLPVLLSMQEVGKDENPLEIAKCVYETGTERAQACGVHRMVSIGTYDAYHSLLTSCLTVNPQN